MAMSHKYNNTFMMCRSPTRHEAIESDVKFWSCRVAAPAFSSDSGERVGAGRYVWTFFCAVSFRSRSRDRIVAPDVVDAPRPRPSLVRKVRPHRASLAPAPRARPSRAFLPSPSRDDHRHRDNAFLSRRILGRILDRRRRRFARAVAPRGRRGPRRVRRGRVQIARRPRLGGGARRDHPRPRSPGRYRRPTRPRPSTPHPRRVRGVGRLVESLVGSLVVIAARSRAGGGASGVERRKDARTRDTAEREITGRRAMAGRCPSRGGGGARVVSLARLLVSSERGVGDDQNDAKGERELPGIGERVRDDHGGRDGGRATDVTGRRRGGG